MIYLLVETDTNLCMWCGMEEPTLTTTSAKCGSEIFMCYNNSNCFVQAWNSYEVLRNFAQRKYKVVSGEVVANPEYFDVQAAETLKMLKEAKNAEINEKRLLANSTSFAFQGKHIAVDTLSTKDLIIASLHINNLNSLPSNWRGGWKTIDNSYVAIPDVSTWKTFITAMYNQGDSNFEYSQQLKQRLKDATTPEEVAGVVW